MYHIKMYTHLYVTYTLMTYLIDIKLYTDI